MRQLSCECCRRSFGALAWQPFCHLCGVVSDAQLDLLSACRALDGLAQSTYGEPLNGYRRDTWVKAVNRLVEAAEALRGVL